MMAWRRTTLPASTGPLGTYPKSGKARPGWFSSILLALLVLVAFPAAAHVTLEAPNGGEMLTEGDQVEIRWQVVIEHNLDNWDLWYSATGDGGPWIPIAIDLPAGDGTAGSVHTHLWTVPGEDSGQVRVRVRQDNFGMDYLDFSDADLTIVPAGVSNDLFADGFESGDTEAWSAAVP